MTESELKYRLKKFAIDVYRFTRQFPKETVYFVIDKQILRSSSSCASNYRAACQGKSGLDFIYKLRIVEEELDETLFWFEYTNGVDPKWIESSKPLMKEGNELLSITIASIRTRLKGM